MTHITITIPLMGAGCLGAVIGWYLYYINRYRQDNIKIEDFAAIIAALGGGVTTTFFDTTTALFGAYGIGLFIGFFGYFSALIIMVNKSNNFGIEWFLDGRRKKPQPLEDYICPSDTPNRPMAD